MSFLEAEVEGDGQSKVLTFVVDWEGCCLYIGLHAVLSTIVTPSSKVDFTFSDSPLNEKLQNGHDGPSSTVASASDSMGSSLISISSSMSSMSSYGNPSSSSSRKSSSRYSSSRKSKVSIDSISSRSSLVGEQESFASVKEASNCIASAGTLTSSMGIRGGVISFLTTTGAGVRSPRSLFLRGSSLILLESDSVCGGEASVTATERFDVGFEKKWKSVFVSGFTGDRSVFCRFFGLAAIVCTAQSLQPRDRSQCLERKRRLDFRE